MFFVEVGEQRKSNSGEQTLKVTCIGVGVLVDFSSWNTLPQCGILGLQIIFFCEGVDARKVFHEASNMAVMEDPTKRFCEGITGVDFSWNAGHVK